MKLVLFDAPIGAIFETQEVPAQDLSLMIVDRVRDLVQEQVEGKMVAFSPLRREGKLFVAEATLDRGRRDTLELKLEFFLEEEALCVELECKEIRSEEIPSSDPLPEEDTAMSDRVESATSVIRLVDSLLS